MDILTIMLGIIVFLLMMGLGATLTFAEFRRALRQWRAPLTGFLCQVVLMPLLAFALAKIFGVSNAVGLSIVVVGACPGGSTSNLFAFWSKGDLSLSITMTALSSVLSFGTLPLLLVIYAPAFTDANLQVDFVAVVQALGLVLVPVAIGVTVKFYNDVAAWWLEKVGSVAGVIFIVAAIIYGSITEESMWQSEWNTWIVAVFLLILGASLGYSIAYFIMGLHPLQCRTIALETGIQNTTLAIAILAFTFDKPGIPKSTLVAVLQFPLLFSLFLIIDAVILTSTFYYVARFDPPLPPDLKAAMEEAERVKEEARKKREGGKGSGEAGEGDEEVVGDAGEEKGEESGKDTAEAEEDEEERAIVTSKSGVAPHEVV